MTIPVSDLERSVDFYSRVLTFERDGADSELAGEAWEKLVERARSVAQGQELIEALEIAGVEAERRGDFSEARRWFDALAEGGRTVMAFAEMPWSPGYGSVIDKFGVPWMINTMR